jgi:tetratricopeptide (TPR) repeat protein
MAVERKDCPPATLALLGEIYERARRLDAARDVAERALFIDPVCGQARLLLARLERQAGRLHEAEQRLKTFPANADPALRVSASYELGNVLDRLGKYDDAMQAFLAAKALLQPHAYRPAHELKVMRARIQHLTDHATTDLLKQWAEAAGQLQPQHRLALLGGHPRSGTTLLEQVLDSHPEIISAEETEVFQNDAYGRLMQNHPDEVAMFQGLATATLETLQKSRENYFRSMNLALGQPVGPRLLIDKNPSYTFLTPALARIFPEIKFIIALRDPRDVVLSCFMQNLPLNQVGAAFLTLAGSADEYNCLMNTWRTMAPRLSNPWLEVRYEDMVEDLEAVARKTLDFLGVPWDASVLGFNEHARQKAVRSPTYADVTQPVYKRAKGRWHNYQKYLEPYLGKLQPFVKMFGYD